MTWEPDYEELSDRTQVILQGKTKELIQIRGNLHTTYNLGKYNQPEMSKVTMLASWWNLNWWIYIRWLCDTNIDSWFGGLYISYAGKWACFGERHSGVFRGDGTSSSQKIKRKTNANRHREKSEQ